jgi:hypothetical protein
MIRRLLGRLDNCWCHIKWGPHPLRRAQRISVSPSGNDRRGDGTPERPFRTLKRACWAVPTIVDGPASIDVAGEKTKEADAPSDR